MHDENPHSIGTSAARGNFSARVRRERIYRRTFFRKLRRVHAAAAGRGAYTQN
jgi:hypothetical protein